MYIDINRHIIITEQILCACMRGTRGLALSPVSLENSSYFL